MAHPFSLFLAPTVFLPTLAYSVAFAYSNVRLSLSFRGPCSLTPLSLLSPSLRAHVAFEQVLLTVEIPSLLGRKYELTPQGVGLQFIAACIGAILGELVAGRGSDLFMQYRTKRARGNREAEMRLPFAFPGYLLSVSLSPIPTRTTSANYTQKAKKEKEKKQKS